jgi:hypothetical protein
LPRGTTLIIANGGGYVGKEITTEIDAMLARIDTEAASTEDIAKFRELLRQHPDLWRQGGDLFVHAQNAVADSLFKKQRGVAESIKYGVNRLRDELGGSTPIERILVDQVVLCKLHLDVRMLQYSREPGRTIQDADFLERRLNSLQKRFLRAVEMLARVRRMMHLPGIQINVGEQQIVMNAHDTSRITESVEPALLQGGDR